MYEEDVRWQQRFSNYKKALANLQRGLRQESFNELERQGLIKAFEICYELAWKTLQDLLHSRGYDDIAGPKPTIRKAFADGLIQDGALWHSLHEARNLAAHTYDLEHAVFLEKQIRDSFLSAYEMLEQHLQVLIP